MKAGSLLLAAFLLVPLPVMAAATPSAVHPEARPFDENADAAAQVDAAIARAAARGHRALLVFGANWCHDSRSLAGRFALPRFKAMLDKSYELVWIDVGQKDRNINLARRFGLDGIKGTPTVLVVDGAGKPRNLKDAPKWRNASTRGDEAIYDYFARGKATR